MKLLLLAWVVVIAVGLIPLAESDNYVMWIKLYVSGDYIPYDLFFVDEIPDNTCIVVEDRRTLGCALIPIGTIYIVDDVNPEFRDEGGHDIYLHEYLHARCEHELILAGIRYNWHYENGEDTVIMPNINYWETCGFDFP